MKNLLFCLAILVGTTACKKNNPSPGNLSISLDDALFNNSYYSKDSLSPTFYLDTISYTRTYTIVAKNTGTTDIRSIKFSCDNENFEFSLTEINLLSPGNSNSWRIPFNIIHGKTTGGLIANVLKAGNNIATITIRGEVDNGAGYTNIEIKAKIHFYAKLMDISLFSGTSEIDLAKPPSEVRYLTEGCSYAYEYFYDTVPFLLKNTGNTDISLYLYLPAYPNENNTLIQNAFLHAGDTVTLKLPMVNTSDMPYLLLCSGGTQTNERRIMTGQDGNGYIGFRRTPGPNN